MVIWVKYPAEIMNEICYHGNMRAIGKVLLVAIGLSSIITYKMAANWPQFVNKQQFW